MDSQQATYHTPVMLEESMRGLDIKLQGIYVDATFGGGGHSKELLSRLGDGGRLFAFDQDSDARGNLPSDPRLTFVQSNFRYLSNWMRYYGVEHIDGLLADLGVSSHHFDDGSRGFSFRQDGPLDMRMNKSARLSAADVVNEYDEQQLASLLHLYGELRNARRVAQAIVKARAERPIATTMELAECLKGLFPREREKKEVTKVFQALRIEVNHEMEALTELLDSATTLLASGGRLVVITYHSLEDRIVKNMMRAGNTAGVVEKDFYGRSSAPLKPLTNKPETPTQEETEANPRSRSAKLRVAEKL
ncbi:MAG: 16S rRNA (cytosine(1402)-N(4))-methyltransferase RsmH [Prevotella sp.]|nr:16S rRNA (cytosine(1402)-N(4))-methyltransferase RsmH [Prevotella sp.]